MPPKVHISQATAEAPNRTKPPHQSRIKRWAIQVILLPIHAYQYLIAPLIANTCRFYPSCSAYTKEAITKHGVSRGIRLGRRRLVRCHPGGGSGYDPVP